MSCHSLQENGTDHNANHFTPLDPDTPIEVLSSSIPLHSPPKMCISCKRSSPPLQMTPPGQYIHPFLIHSACMQIRGCAHCGATGLLDICPVPSCNYYAHPWCSGTFPIVHANHSDGSQKKHKENSKLEFIRFQLRKLLEKLQSGQIQVRESLGSFCNGHIFWYVVNLEYFPPQWDLGVIPQFPSVGSSQAEFPSLEPDLSTHLFCEKGRARPSNQYVSYLLRLYSNELKVVSAQNQEKLRDLVERGQSAVPARNTDEKAYMADFPFKDKAVKTETSAKCAVCLQPEQESRLNYCKVCGICAHFECYFFQQICEPCQDYSLQIRKNLPCALCPVKGGALKPTIHSYQEKHWFLNYMNFTCRTRREKYQKIWVHLLCARSFRNTIFGEDGIRLNEIDKKGFSLKCEICGTKDGCCLQCSFSKCTSAFHPGCAVQLFAGARNPKPFCGLHRPLKLRKILEQRNKRLLEDLFKFCKQYQKLELKIGSTRSTKRLRDSKQKQNQWKSFTLDEDMALQFRVHQFLHKLNLSQTKPFILSISPHAATRRQKISISRPNFYTIIAPEVILEQKLTIQNKSPDDCYKRYQDTLFNKIRNELLLRSKKINSYQGKEIKYSDHKHNTRSQQMRLAKRVNNLPIPYITSPSKKKKRIKSMVSTQKYCICNKPYYFSLVQKPGQSDEQFQKALKENQMIECTNCLKWFHLTCMNEQISNITQQQPWKCLNCRAKKRKPFALDSLDQSAIVSDIKSGVVTRRGNIKWQLTLYKKWNIILMKLRYFRKRFFLPSFPAKVSTRRFVSDFSRKQLILRPSKHTKEAVKKILSNTPVMRKKRFDFQGTHTPKLPKLKDSSLQTNNESLQNFLKNIPSRVEIQPVEEGVKHTQNSPLKIEQLLEGQIKKMQKLPQIDLGKKLPLNIKGVSLSPSSTSVILN